MDIRKLIHVGDFCSIVTDKFAEEMGVKRGHLVYVAGLKALPITEEDPYTQRIKMFCHLSAKDGTVTTDKLYVIDPNSIQKVGKSRQKILTKKLEEDFKPNEPIPVEEVINKDSTN